MRRVMSWRPEWTFVVERVHAFRDRELHLVGVRSEARMQS
jgi:hypothetical protein